MKFNPLLLIRRTITLCLLVTLACLSLNGYSQSASFDTIPSATSPSMQKQNHFIPRKMDFGIQVGTQFSTSSYGTGFSTFISPHLTYRLSKRFSMSGGVSIVNTSLNGLSYTSVSRNEYSLNGNYTSAMVFLSGQYLVNERLTISGTAYKQFNLFGNIPGYKSFGNNDAQGIYMNVKYTILENVHLEAGFGYSRGYNPFNSLYNDPFNRSFGDPFFHQFP